MEDIDIEQAYFPCDDIDREALIGDNQAASDAAEAYSDDWRYHEKDSSINNMDIMVDNLFTMFER